MERWLFILSGFIFSAAAVWFFSRDAEIDNEAPLKRPRPELIATAQSQNFEIPQREELIHHASVVVFPQKPQVVVALSASQEQRVRLSTDDECAKLYGAFSVEQLEREAEDVRNEITDATSPLYQQRFDAGSFDVLGYGNDFTYPLTDQLKLVSYQFAPTSQGTQIRRVELLDQEYPELYAKLRKARWLREEAGRKGAELKSRTDGR